MPLNRHPRTALEMEREQKLALERERASGKNKKQDLDVVIVEVSGKATDQNGVVIIWYIVQGRSKRFKLEKLIKLKK